MQTKFRYKKAVREEQIRMDASGQLEKTTRESVNGIDFEYSQISSTSIISKISVIAVPVLRVIEILRFLVEMILSVL